MIYSNEMYYIACKINIWEFPSFNLNDEHLIIPKAREPQKEL